MSIGSWILALCILASLAYAYTFLGQGNEVGEEPAGLRRALAWIGVPLGIAVAVYTGILLGAMPARPFWNSPVLALLFLMSSLSTGVAAILLLKVIFGGNNSHALASEPMDGGQFAKSAYLLVSQRLRTAGTTTCGASRDGHTTNTEVISPAFLRMCRIGLGTVPAARYRAESVAPVRGGLAGRPPGA